MLGRPASFIGELLPLIYSECLQSLLGSAFRARYSGSRPCRLLHSRSGHLQEPPWVPPAGASLFSVSGPHWQDGSHLDNPAHWIARAETARTIAEQITDPESKQTMLAIADGYEATGMRL